MDIPGIEKHSGVWITLMMMYSDLTGHLYDVASVDSDLCNLESELDENQIKKSNIC
jgi:hypothetical protein